MASGERCFEYIFKHALLRDVTYETVLLRDRASLHARVARWLADNAGERLPEFLEIIAEHHRLAGDLVAAAELLVASAERTRDVGGSVASRRLYERALGLWDELGVDPAITVLLALGEACVRMNDLDAAQEAADRALLHCSDLGDEAQALSLASWVASIRGDHVRGRALIHQAMPVAETVVGPCWSMS